MLDPVICAGMTFGGPRVDLAALVELERLLIGAINPALCRSDVAIVPEEGNAISQSVGGGAGSAVDPDIRPREACDPGARDQQIGELKITIGRLDANDPNQRRLSAIRLEAGRSRAVSLPRLSGIRANSVRASGSS